MPVVLFLYLTRCLITVQECAKLFRFIKNDTIDYILDQIYVQQKLKPICSKLIFKRLLIKLSTEVTFTFNDKFCKQIDGCTMGGPLSVTFSDIYMTKMERDVVRPFNPIFYRRYVDDIYNR